MKVIIPERYTEFESMTSNLPQNRYPAWASGTSYAVGDKVTRGNHEYEALTISTGQDPALVTSTTYWLDLGFSNRYKPFSGMLSDPATAIGNIQYTIDPQRLFTSVVLFGAIGRSVTIEIFFNSVLQYTETRELVTSPNVVNWFDYFFLPVEGTTEVLFSDLPGYAGSTIRITLVNSGASELAQIVIGEEFSIGTLNEDSTISIQDFSRKERDEFGRVTLVERSYAQVAEYDIAVPTYASRQIQRKLADIRAIPAVYYGGVDDDMLGTMIFGFFTNFQINLKAGEISFMTLTVEGLV